MSDNGKTRHAGRLELTWTDKDKALLSAIDGKYDYTFVDPADWRVSEVRLLDEVERYDREPDPDAPEDNQEPWDDNLLISGDAMHVLDALAKIPEYADRHVGKVKLVYIDPPFPRKLTCWGLGCGRDLEPCCGDVEAGSIAT